MATERIIIEFQAKGTRTVDRRIKSIGRSARKSSDILGQMRNLLVVVAAVRVIRRFTDLADSMVNLRNRLQATLGSFGAAVDAQEKLVAISLETRTGLDATGDAFARLALGAKDLGLTTDTLLGITTTLNKAIILSGASAQEAQNAMIQLSQGIASGALRGDELRAVLEQLPLVARIIADEFEVPLGKLRELGEEGKLTTERLVAAFQRAEDAVAKDFANTIVTIDQALANLGTNFIVFIDRFSQSTGAANALVFALSGLESLFGVMGDNIAVLNGLIAFGLVLGFLKLSAVILATQVGMVAWNVTATLAIAITRGWTTTLFTLGVVLSRLSVFLAANPFIAWALAIAAVVAVTVTLISASETLTDRLSKEESALRGIRQELDKGTITTEKAAKAKRDDALASRSRLQEELKAAQSRTSRAKGEDIFGIAEALGQDFGQDTVNRIQELLDGISKTVLQETEALRRDLRTKGLLAKGDLIPDDVLDAIDEFTDKVKLLRFSLANSARDVEIFEALAELDLEFGSTSAGAEKLSALVGEAFDLAAALDAAEDAAKDAAKALEKLTDEAKELSENNLATQIILLEEQLVGLKPHLISLLGEEADAERILTQARKEGIEALHEEFAPELIALIDERKSLTERLAEVEATRNEQTKLAFQITGDMNSAIMITNQLLKDQKAAIVDEDPIQQLIDKYFTAEKSAEDLNEELRILNEFLTAQPEKAEMAAAAIALQAREMAGLSMATHEYNMAIQALTVNQEAAGASAEEVRNKQRDLTITLLESQTTLEAGVQRFFLKMNRDAEDTASQIENVLSNAFSGAKDALVDFITTGKADFSSLADSIVKDIVKMALQATISNIGASLFGGGTTIGQASQGGGIQNLIGLFSGLFGGAHGGSFPVNRNSSVGSTPGVDNRLIAFRARDGEQVHITQKSEAGGSGGGGNTVINFNVKSDDADSFLRSASQIQNKMLFGAQSAARRR